MSNETASKLAEEFGKAARAARADLEEATTRVQQLPLDGTYDATDRLSIMQQAVDAAEAADRALDLYHSMYQAAMARTLDGMDDATTRLWLMHWLAGVSSMGNASKVATWASREILMEGLSR